MKFWMALITLAFVLSAGACAQQRAMREASMRRYQQQQALRIQERARPLHAADSSP
jgi:hypothetical protein